MTESSPSMPAIASPSDGELLAAIAKGNDPEAIRCLVERHGDWVYAVSLRGARDPSLAADCAQATFLLLWRKASRLAGADERAVVSWLFRTARNHVSNARRLRQRRQTHERKAAMQRPEASGDPLLDSPERHAMLAALDGAIEKLSATDRSAVILRFFRRRRFVDIASALGTTEEAARKRVARAVVQLREHLALSGVAIAPAALTTALGEAVVAPAPGGLLTALPTANAQSLLAVSMKTAWWTTLATAASIVAAVAVIGAALVTLIQLQRATPPPIAGATAPGAAAPLERRNVTGYAGRIFLPDGSPLAGARVTAVGIGRSDLDAAMPTVESAMDGSFTLPAPAWATDDTFSVLIESDTAGLSAARLRRDYETIVRLRPTAEVHVPIIGADGQPAVGVRIVVAQIASNMSTPIAAHSHLPAVASERWSGVSDQNGIARIAGVPYGGLVQLKCMDTRFRLRSVYDMPFVQVNVPAQPAFRTNRVELAASATIKGRLVGRSGEPIADVLVEAEPSGAFARTAADGTYALAGLLPGKYTVGVRGLPGELRTTAAVESIEVDVTNEPGVVAPDMRIVDGVPVSGQVVGPGGKGVPATIGIYTPGDISRGALRLFETDPEGRFSFRAAGLTAYVYVYQTPTPTRFHTVEPQIIDFSMYIPDSIDFDLVPKPQQPVTLRGIVRDEHNRPVPFASIKAQLDARADADDHLTREVLGNTVLADAYGRFVFEGLPVPARLTAGGDVSGEPAATIEPTPARSGDAELALQIKTKAFYTVRVKTTPGQRISVQQDLPGGYGIGIFEGVANEAGEVVIPNLRRDASYRVTIPDPPKGSTRPNWEQVRPRDDEIEVTVHIGDRGRA